MKKIIISLIMLSAGVFYSCKKADNLTPAPTASLDSAIIFLKEENKTVRATSIGNVSNGSTVTLKMTITAKAGFEQIDYKVYGDQTVWTGDRPNLFVNGSGKSFVNQNVPFDWVNLNTIRSGFDSENSTKMEIRFPNVNQVTKMSFIITDKNLLQSYFDVVITPVNFGNAGSNVVLFTQKATLADVGGTAADKKLFYSLNKGLASDTTASNNSIAEFAVINDSLSNTWLLSANLVKEDSLIKYGIDLADTIHFSKKSPIGAVDFAETLTLNSTNATINDLLNIQTTTYTNKVKVEAGKSYLFRTANNQSGVITINSIQNSTSGAVNAVVNFSYKSIVLRQ